MMSDSNVDLQEGLAGGASAATGAIIAAATSAEAEEQPPQPVKCPAGHMLIHARAPRGRCDRCGGHVEEGRWVRECKECNWYLCGICTPITECPHGHALQTAESGGARCGGCEEWMPEGKLVMECQQCSWALCKFCQPLTQCLQGHELKVWASRAAGRCHRCSKAVKPGDVVMDCHICQWSLCSGCQPQLSAAAAFWGTSASPPAPLPQCPAGHDALPALVKGGKSCAQCGKELGKGAMVSQCAQCSWQLCTECHAIRQCPTGHMLEARPAPPGKCDGCGKRVEMYQAVMDCRQCNWYLCGSCHIPSARSPAKSGA